MPTRPLIDVLRDHTPELMRHPEVIGTAEGEEDGHPVLVILMRRMPPGPSGLPSTIEGYPVRLRVVGEVRADSAGRRP